MRDGAARFHVQVANELALVPGLDGHQDVSEDVRGIGANLLSGERDFDPAFHDKVTRVGSVQVAFAPAPGVDLALDRDDLRTQVVVGGQCLVGRGAMNAFQHRYAIALEQGFALVFMDVHGAPGSRSRWAVLQHSAWAIHRWRSVSR